MNKKIQKKIKKAINKETKEFESTISGYLEQGSEMPKPSAVALVAAVDENFPEKLVPSCNPKQVCIDSHFIDCKNFSVTEHVKQI